MTLKLYLFASNALNQMKSSKNFSEILGNFPHLRDFLLDNCKTGEDTFLNNLSGWLVGWLVCHLWKLLLCTVNRLQNTEAGNQPDPSAD